MNHEQLAAELERAQDTNNCMGKREGFTPSDLPGRATAALRECDAEIERLKAKSEMWRCKHMRKAVAFEYLYWAFYNLLVYPNSSPDTNDEEKLEEAEKLLKSGLFHDEVENDCGYAETHILVAIDEFANLQAERDTLTARVAELEAAVRPLPHSAMCSSWSRDPETNTHKACDCPKRVLEDKP